ncbi:phage holin family protein [Paenibacillus arenilitoris]|uniref:Phage holin family protein n=1 Tax=Paenibacillus arenilitoris TaxID=2772299 RepID=A0A927H8T8_9BACL|nr:phage holin family protein [Paenibacillus arenilitoris]MBD2870949.1 phage holin family protein [Paenibacillus arenilitoris]
MYENFAAIYDTLSGWAAAIYGEGRLPPLLLLAAATGLDWITGIAAAWKDRAHAAEYGRMGILRTAFVLLLPMFASLLDGVLGMPGLFFYAVTIGLIYRTWQSITANAYRAGWERLIPKSVLQMIEGELRSGAVFPKAAGEDGQDESGENRKQAK